jgi:hypothetical protein
MIFVLLVKSHFQLYVIKQIVPPKKSVAASTRDFTLRSHAFSTVVRRGNKVAFSDNNRNVSREFRAGRS